MHTNEIRRAFLDFFSARDHVVRPSASLIPTDPTLLLTNAGMVPFKPYLLGEEPPPWPRAVTVQKVARTVDIDIIGTTARHLTFFEMLGNFSFGDYFKQDAIRYAYTFITETLGLDADLLWYTVYDTDDEAAAIWIDEIGIDPDRVQRGGNDNFWQMGVPGPCGPSSEIFIDRGSAYGADGGPIGGGEDRFVELWNLVFMQKIQDEPYNVVGDLPARNIDTGTGLERLAMVLQGVDTLFEGDSVADVLGRAATELNISYGQAEASDVALRILADHARASTFLIGDKVMPGNEGRGYVVRRLLRRAIRHAWQLGGDKPIMTSLVETTCEIMSDAYPELASGRDFILDVVGREEQQFRRTLATGTELLDDALAEVGEPGVLSGRVAFKLHDTYGFPIDLTEEIVAERGSSVDRPGFDVEMQDQRQRAKAAWKGGEAVARIDAYKQLLDVVGPTEFVGYEVDEATSRVLAILRDGVQVDRAEKGEQVEVFLDTSPFYAEAGGQVGDTGALESETGLFEVRDTQATVSELRGHHGTVSRGRIQAGQQVDARIDSPRRARIRKSHTGTHVLHWALREVIGDHANQAGSLVEDGRLRFDFNHFAPVAAPELGEIEDLVNTKIVSNSSVGTVETTKDEAEQMGALAFFGDKYGESVRVVKVGEYSVEFCGGTHVGAAGEIGPLLLTSEASIGSNLRRVEALTGMTAYRHAAAARDALSDVGQFLQAGSDEVPARVRALADKADALQAQLDAADRRTQGAAAAELAESAELSGEVRHVVAAVDAMSTDGLRAVATQVRDRLGPSVVMLGSTVDGKGTLVGLVSKELVNKGVSAGDLVMVGAKLLGGGGSRDPELSQAGGPRGEKLDEGLDAIRQAVARQLAGL